MFYSNKNKTQFWSTLMLMLLGKISKNSKFPDILHLIIVI